MLTFSPPSIVALVIAAIGLAMTANLFFLRGLGGDVRVNRPFALFCLTFSAYAMLAGLRHYAIDDNHIRRFIQLESLLACCSLPMAMVFIRELTGKRTRLDRWLAILLLLAVLLCGLSIPTELLFTSTPLSHEIWFFGRTVISRDVAPGPLMPAFVAVVAIALSWAAWRLFDVIRSGMHIAIPLLAGTVVLMLSGINDMLVMGGVIPGTYCVGYGFLALAASGSVSMVLRSRSRAREMLQATHELKRLRKVEDQLAQSERLAVLGRTLSGVSHKLNNPLTTVVSVAESLPIDAFSPADHSRVELMRREAVRAGNLVKGLLDIAHGENQEHRPMDVRNLVVQLLELRSEVQLSAGLDMVWHPGKQAALVMCDPDQLFQLLFNLVVNAEQALTGRSGTGGAYRADGRICIASRVDDDRVTLTIEDNGPGIPAGVLPHIFDPFFTTKQRRKGTGLGLFLAATVVERHGGTLAARNLASGGACVTITLPLSDQDEDPNMEPYFPSVLETSLPPLGVEAPAPAATSSRPSAASTQRHEPLKHLRVLVIDDEPGVLVSLGAALETVGATVGVAHGSAEAIDLVTQDWDVILCDVLMPEMNGLELFEWYQQTEPHLCDRFVFMTGDIFAKEARALAKRRNIQLLQKPFRTKAMVDVILQVGHPQERPSGVDIILRGAGGSGGRSGGGCCSGD